MVGLSILPNGNQGSTFNMHTCHTNTPSNDQVSDRQFHATISFYYLLQTETIREKTNKAIMTC